MPSTGFHGVALPISPRGKEVPLRSGCAQRGYRDLVMDLALGTPRLRSAGSCQEEPDRYTLVRVGMSCLHRSGIRCIGRDIAQGVADPFSGVGSVRIMDYILRR